MPPTPSNYNKSFSWTPSKSMFEKAIDIGGSDFYVIHEERFKSNCQRFSKAFNDLYPNVKMGYSVKTNYLPHFILQTQKLGWYTEVVSGFEYDLAWKLGSAGENIIFNGPVKKDDELAIALSRGSIINIDSENEVSRIIDLAAKHNYENIKIALRLNLESRISTKSHFGICIKNQLTSCLKQLNKSRKIELFGLHVHYCFKEKKAENYKKLSECLCELIEELNLFTTLKNINFGGGFFSPMPESMSKNWGGNIPNYNDYAKSILAPVSALAKKYNCFPEVTLEPGLAILADAASYVTTVHSIKKTYDRFQGILSGSIYNIKPTKSMVQMPFLKIEMGNKSCYFNGALYGYTCMEDDVMIDDYKGLLSVDDKIIFSNVGAYTNVLNPSFIRLSPAFILDSLSGEFIMLHEAEKSDEFIKRRLS